MIVKLNIVTTLLLAAIFVGVYIVVSLLSKRSGKITTYFISSATLLMTTVLAQYFLVLSGGYRSFPHLLGIPLIVLAALAPALFLFASTNFTGRKLMWYDVFHFIPSIYLFYMNYPVLLAPSEMKVRAIDMQWTGSIEFSWYYFIFLAALTAQMSVYLIFISRILSSGYKAILQESADPVIMRMKRMSMSMKLYVVFMVIFLTAYSFTSLKFSYTATLEGIIMLVMSTFIFPVGYYFLKNELPSRPQKIPVAEEKYKNSPLTNDHTADILSRLKSHMTTQKPYLNPNLKIQDLSEELDIPRHHLSQIINQETDSNFFDFINQYRVEEAKSKLIDDRFAHLTIQGIGLDCGFSNKSSFYRIFKKYTQHTPSAYIKLQKSHEMSPTF